MLGPGDDPTDHDDVSVVQGQVPAEDSWSAAPLVLGQLPASGMGAEAAAASGLAAVEVVRETVVKHRGRERQPRTWEWAQLLEQLSRQLDDGRVYDRDLADIRAALAMVAESAARRRGPRPPRRRRTRGYAAWQIYK